MNTFLPKTKKTIKAFTLVETMVASFIVATVILGPLTVSINALTYARETKDTMTAIYLAQEALELLHHQQDSLYIQCVSPFTSIGSTYYCDPSSGTPSEVAWRKFRDSLGDGGSQNNVSCYTNDNLDGCAYDFIDMTGTAGNTLTKYSSTAGLCTTLSTSTSSNQRLGYVCTGVHGTGAGYIPTKFQRTLNIESIPTFGGYGTQDSIDNGDLRATVTVSLKRATGYKKQIKVVEFLHARS